MRIYKALCITAMVCAFSGPAQASCPGTQDIINAFHKDGLPPQGWALLAYTGKQMDQDFYFNKARWSAIGREMARDEGNIQCEYSNNTKKNPGYLIIESTDAVLPPEGQGWSKLNHAKHTVLCHSTGKPDDCAF